MTALDPTRPGTDAPMERLLFEVKKVIVGQDQVVEELRPAEVVAVTAPRVEDHLGRQDRYAARPEDSEHRREPLALTRGQ
mgnify:CR=1 FL=1